MQNLILGKCIIKNVMDHITLTHCTKICWIWLHLQSFIWNLPLSMLHALQSSTVLGHVVYESYLPSHLNCNYTSRFFGEGWTMNGSLHILLKSPLRYAMVSSGRRVKGTRYSRAGWAALKTSDDTVAVSNPKK